MKRLLVLFVLILGLIYACIFIVPAEKFAVQYDPSHPNVNPKIVYAGLHFKLPLKQKIVFGDQRAQLLAANGAADAPYLSAQTFDKHTLEIDYVVVWQVSNPLMFYRAGMQSDVLNLLREQLNKNMEDGVSLLTLPQLLMAEQQQVLTTNLLNKLNKSFSSKGIKIDNVFIVSLNIANAERATWLDQMKATQAKQLDQLRQEAATFSQTLREDSEQKVAKIIENASKEAGTIRAKADLDATAIYAEAYNKNPGFYEFFHNLQMYKKILTNKQDVLVLSTHTPFFKSLAPSEVQEKNAN